MNWLQHPAINLRYVAALLYGSNTGGNSSKLSKKIKGTRKWQEGEIEKLEQIRQQIISELTSLQ